MTRSRSETAPPALMHVLHNNEGPQVHSSAHLPGISIRFLKDCTNDLKRCIDARAVKANLTGLSKSDVGVLFSKLAAEAEKLQSVNFLVQPAMKSRGGKDQAKRCREVDFKSEEYAAALKDLALRTTGGKVEKIFKSSVVALFREATDLEELTVGMPLPMQLFSALTQALVSIQRLHSLSLRGSRLADAKCAQLCGALCDCRSLKTLDLTGCSLTDVSATVVAAFVKKRANNYCLERFKKLLRCYPDATMSGQLRRTLLYQDVRAIRDDLLTSCPGLKHINLSQNELTDRGADDLFGAAAMEVGLMSLQLRSNNLTLKAGRSARTTMLEHPCLEVIDMRLNSTPKLRQLRRSHVHKLLEDGSTPYDELTACLRMCGVSMKEAQEMQTATADPPIKACALNSAASPLNLTHSASMNSPVAGSPRIKSAQHQWGTFNSSQIQSNTGRRYTATPPPDDSPDGEVLTVAPASMMCAHPSAPRATHPNTAYKSQPKSGDTRGRRYSANMKQQARRLTQSRPKSSEKSNGLKKRSVKKTTEQQIPKQRPKILPVAKNTGSHRSIHARRSSSKGRRSADFQARQSNANATAKTRALPPCKAAGGVVQTLLQMPYEETLFVEQQQVVLCDQHSVTGALNGILENQSTTGMVQGHSSHGSNSMSGAIEPTHGPYVQQDVAARITAAAGDTLSPCQHPDHNSLENYHSAVVGESGHAVASLLQGSCTAQDEGTLLGMGNCTASASPSDACDADTTGLNSYPERSNGVTQTSPQCDPAHEELYTIKPCSPEADGYGLEASSEARLEEQDEEQGPPAEPECSNSPGSIPIAELPSEAPPQQEAEQRDTRDDVNQNLGNVDSLSNLLEPLLIEPQLREDSMVTHADPTDDAGRNDVLEDNCGDAGVSGTRHLSRGAFGSLIECDPDKVQALHQQLVPELSSQQQIQQLPVPIVPGDPEDLVRMGPEFSDPSLVQPMTTRKNGLYPSTENNRQREKMPLNPLRAGAIAQFRHTILDQGLAGAFEATFDAQVGFNMPEEQELEEKTALEIPEEEMSSIAEGFETLRKLQRVASDDRRGAKSVREECSEGVEADDAQEVFSTAGKSREDAHHEQATLQSSKRIDNEALGSSVLDMIDRGAESLEGKELCMPSQIGLRVQRYNNRKDKASMCSVEAASSAATGGQRESLPEGSSGTQTDDLLTHASVVPCTAAGSVEQEGIAEEMSNALRFGTNAGIGKTTKDSRGVEACAAHMASIKSHIKALMHCYHELEGEMMAFGQ